MQIEALRRDLEFARQQHSADLAATDAAKSDLAECSATRQEIEARLVELERRIAETVAEMDAAKEAAKEAAEAAAFATEAALTSGSSAEDNSVIIDSLDDIDIAEHGFVAEPTEYVCTDSDPPVNHTTRVSPEKLKERRARKCVA